MGGDWSEWVFPLRKLSKHSAHRPALQSIPPSRPSAGAITSACWRCSDQAARTTAFSRFAGRDHAPDVLGMQQADVMVRLKDWDNPVGQQRESRYQDRREPV